MVARRLFLALCLLLVSCAAMRAEQVAGAEAATEVAATTPVGVEPAHGDAGSGAPAPSAALCTEAGGSAGDTTIAIRSGGLEREAVLHAPPGYDGTRALPLVVVLHPLLLDHVQMREMVRIERFSDEGTGFLALFPNGVDKSWNAGECCGTAREQNVDDVGFIRDLLREVARSHCVDETRVFAMGFSNGAFLAHRLACELDGAIRAIVPVAGTLGIPEGQCARTAPLPVLAFHGTEDKLVPYEGGKPTGLLGVFGRVMDAAGTFASPRTTDAFWAKHNGLPAATVPALARGDVACQRHEGAASVTLCTVTNGGHQWPGSLKPLPVMGRLSTDVDATEAAVSFFRENGL